MLEGLGGSASFASFPLWLWVTLLAPDGALAVGFLLVSRRLRQVHIAHRWHGKTSSLVLFVVVTLGIANVEETAIFLGSLASLALIGNTRRSARSHRPPFISTPCGVDVLRCPCGGRRRIHAISSTRKTAEERLLQLGHQLPSRLILPPTTAQPSLPLAG